MSSLVNDFISGLIPLYYSASRKLECNISWQDALGETLSARTNSVLSEKKKLSQFHKVATHIYPQ